MGPPAASPLQDPSTPDPREPGPRAGGPRRSSLVQERSKQTRRRLVRAAVGLWSDRGFERGVEETTVEEIARAAGVSKGTLYFHFAHKEDILLELGYGTADALFEEAERGARAGRSGVALVQQLLASLAKRAEAVPPAAVARAIAQFRSVGAPPPAAGRPDIHDGLVVALDLARKQGELPAGTDTDELGQVISALAMDSLWRWAAGDRRKLRPVLRKRADLVLAGARSEAGR
jgi:AcrR family transcriptional regulator